MKKKNYILITSAYNSEDTIEKTIKSILNQTVRPKQWIIIDDSSKDKTGSIIKRYAAKHAFITFAKTEQKDKPNFAAKVAAIKVAFTKIKIKDYSFLGILDSDIEHEHDYYSNMIELFLKNKQLGIVGGNIVEFVENKKFRRIKTFNSVAGGIHFYRRECFEQTGGFLPLKFGGEDAAIEIEARMNGWEVRTFPEFEVLHYGYVGGGAGNRYKARFNRGIMFYQLGYHPLFHLTRCLYRIKEKPYITGSIIEFYAYIYAKFKFKKHMISNKVVKYLRKEQLNRMLKLKFKM